MYKYINKGLSPSILQQIGIACPIYDRVHRISSTSKINRMCLIVNIDY